MPFPFVHSVQFGWGISMQRLGWPAVGLPFSLVHMGASMVVVVGLMSLGMRAMR